MLHDDTLCCATCHRRPSIGHGTMHFVIDSTTEEEPSKMTLRQHRFLEKKIDERKAQILSQEGILKTLDVGAPRQEQDCRRRR